MSKQFPTEARWFGGKGRSIRNVSRAEQIPVPGALLAFADVDYAEGGSERYLLLDSVDWMGLLRRLRKGPITGWSGRIELSGMPPLEGPGRQRTVAVDQSNSLIVVDEKLLVKAYRRLRAGPHPEIEMLDALNGSGAPVPASLGSVHHIGADGADTALVLLERFIPGAEEGWEAPIERVADHLRGNRDPPVEEFRVAGDAAARVHSVLRAASNERFGAAEVAALRASAGAQWDDAVRRDADLSVHRAELSARLDALKRLVGLPKQRIHGDLHYAQFLRADGSASIIDFEGDPTQSFAVRRALSLDPPFHPPLKRK